MKLGLLLLVLLAAMLPARSAHAQAPDEPSAEPSAEALAGTRWVQVAWLDPWSGETVRTDSASGAAAHTLTLDEDGGMVEDYEGGCCRREGTWTLDGDALRLAFDDGTPPVTYRIAKLEPDVLQLGARGREGEVIHTFAPRR